jgi:TRAP-type C4-dicarboxylate transport system substrate-binding protein
MIICRSFLPSLMGFVALFICSLAQAAVFKIATIAPEGSEWMVEHRAAAAAIKERTAGTVVLKFYGGGVMGNDRKVLRKVRIGQLQGAAFTTSGLAERYPDIALYGLPFVFQSQQEVDYARELFDAELLQGLEDAGFVSFGFAGGGFANFMSSEPLVTHANLQGKKIWVPEGDVTSFTALESMDLSPVVLPLSDVLTGLQTGLLDVIVSPPVGALLLQWYTKVKYINPLPVAYTLGVLAIDNRAFDRIDPADQEIVREVLTATYLKLDAINRHDNVEALEALVANGLQIVEADPEAIPYWRGVAKETNEKIWKDSAVDPGLYDRLMNALEEYRATDGSSSESDGDSVADARM